MRKRELLVWWILGRASRRCDQEIKTYLVVQLRLGVATLLCGRSDDMEICPHNDGRTHG